MQHFSSPSYIIHHNSHKSDNYFYSTNAKTVRFWMSWFVEVVLFNLS